MLNLIIHGVLMNKFKNKILHTKEDIKKAIHENPVPLPKIMQKIFQQKLMASFLKCSRIWFYKIKNALKVNQYKRLVATV